MNIAIILLAAGSSSRMGKPKQLLAIKDRTLLGQTITNALQSNAKQVFCVLGANAQIIKESIAQYKIEIIINSNYKKGLSSSIVKGLDTVENMNFDAVLIMLGDQPNVDSNDLNRLIISFENHPTKISASKYDKTIGVPAIFPKSYFKSLQQLKGDKGAKTVLNSINADVIPIKSEQLTDIDTENDYLKYLKTLE